MSADIRAFELVGTHPGSDGERRYPFNRQEGGFHTLLADLPAGALVFEIVTATITTTAGEEEGKLGGGKEGGTIQPHSATALQAGGGKLSLDVTVPGWYFFGLEFSDPETPPVLRIHPSKTAPIPRNTADQMDFLADHFLDMPIPVSMVVGRARMTISQLAALGPGSVLVLDTLVGENIQISAGGTRLADGKVVVLNEKFGVRIDDKAQ